MSAERSQRQKGAALGYVSIVLSVFTALAFTPVIIDKLGVAAYGIYILALSFTSYLNILDMGMNEAVTRFLVSARRHGDRTAFEETLGNAVALYGLIGLGVLVLGGVLVWLLPEIVASGMEGEELRMLRFLAALTVGNAMLTVMLNPAGAVLAIEERWVLVRTLEIVGSAGATAIGVATLFLGGNAYTLLLGIIATNVLVQGVKAWYVLGKRAYRPNLKAVSHRMLVSKLSYSAPILFVILVELIYWKLDYVIVAARFGPEAVAVLGIGLMWQKYILSFATAISRVMVPAAVDLVEKGADRDAITKFIVSVARPQGVILALICSGILIFGREFLLLWLGEGFELAYYVMLAVIVPIAVENIGNIRNTILQAKRLYWYRAVLSLAAAAIKLVLTFLLIERYGLVGAAVATGIGLMIGYAAVLVLMQRTGTLKIGEFFVRSYARLLIVLAACIPFGLWLAQAGMPGWIGFTLRVAAYTTAFVVLAWFVVLNGEQRRQYLAALRTRRAT